MSVTRSGPRISTQPFDNVDFPAPESPTRPSMMGRPARNGSGVTLLIADTVVPSLAHAALEDVDRLDPREVLLGHEPPGGDEAVRLAELDAVERVPDAARVGEMG